MVAATNMYRPDGRMRTLSDRLALLLDSALERKDLTVEEFRDIAEQMACGIEELRVAEEELTAQAEQLEASNLAVDAERMRYVQLFEFAPDAYLETDGLGKIVEANSVAERMLGTPIRFLIGKLLLSYVSRSDVRAFRAALSELRDLRAPITMEFGLKPRNLPPVTVELRAVAHFDPAAAHEGEDRVRWLLRDITERKKLDRELVELHASVELLSSLNQLNRLVADSEDPVEPMLEGLVTLAARSCGAAASVVLLDDRGAATIQVVSDQVAGALTDAHFASPMTSAAEQRGGPRVYLVSLDAVPPNLAEAMAAHCIEWAQSQPIVGSDGLALGYLNLYGRGRRDAVEPTVRTLADQAAAVVANGLVYRSAVELSHHLGKALESRGVIEQAKGVVMAWQGCDADAAFDILRRVSQRENRKLRLVAEDIVTKATAPRGTH